MNPLDDLTECARHHLTKYAALAKRAGQETYELPCGCESATLADLADSYGCNDCGQWAYYCFCIDEVLDEETTWYCKVCGKCRDTSEWHCKRCGDCTYGVTLPCDGCGKKSPYMPE